MALAGGPDQQMTGARR